MRMPLRLAGAVAVLAGLAAVMAWFAGFFHTPIDPGTATSTAPVPPPGAVHEVRAIEEAMLEQVSGTVRAKDETVISARITAAISAVHVRAGDDMEAGEVLVELDARDLQARLAQQREAVEAARARVGEARPDFERMESLYARNAVSKAEYDRALARVRTAEAELERMRRLADEARTALSYSTIVAPFAGRVIERLADPGDTAVPAMPLVRMYDPSRLRVEAYLPESLAASLGIGMRLDARIDALDRTLRGTVEEIVPAADPGSRSFLIKVALPAADGVYPGMFGRLFVPVGTATRVYAPPEAIVAVGQLEMVDVVGPSGVVRRPIRTGAGRHEGMIEIRSGLAAGEQVLIDRGAR